MKVAVVAHSGKTLGSGLKELRSVLAEYGMSKPLWSEVDKSRKAPRRVQSALEAGAKLVIVWGGDGMVQRCADVLAGTDVPMAILPAGTANLFAANMGIPHDVREAVLVAMHGERRRVDVGTVNGETFVVMGGAGFDGTLIAGVDKAAKKKLGRIAYVRGTAKAMSTPVTTARIDVDGASWYEGPLSCVLVGNVSTVMGGLRVFENASPTDGLLDVGVVSAEGRLQWLRVLGRLVGPGDPDGSPLVKATQARKIDVRLSEKLPYEIDGGLRSKSRRLKVRVRPDALVVCVPRTQAAGSALH